MNKIMVLKIKLLMIVLAGFTLTASAQLNPFQTMYFQNKYLYNPATAGLEKGLNVNVGYRQQWSGFPGTPKTSTFTADYQSGKNVGIGLNVNDDQEGLIRQTRIVGTYAYHLPLSGKGDKLSLGLSLGVNDARIDYSKVSGDVGDEQIAAYNQLKAYVDGDFGAAYTSGPLYIGGSLPNLKSVFFRSSDDRFDADRLLFITLISYKIALGGMENGDYTLEPLAAIRGVKGYNNIYDIGANFTMNRYGLFLQSVYHTSESMGLGVGIDQKAFAFTFGYGLETGKIGTYTQGTYEFGLKLRLFNKSSVTTAD